MVSTASIREWARALPETSEAPHFEIVSFKVKSKVFATLNGPENRATLRFSRDMQDVFTKISKGAIFPVPNKWGAYGWTHVNLASADPEMVKDALLIAWRETAPPIFEKKYPELWKDE